MGDMTIRLKNYYQDMRMNMLETLDKLDRVSDDIYRARFFQATGSRIVSASTGSSALRSRNVSDSEPCNDTDSEQRPNSKVRINRGLDSSCPDSSPQSFLTLPTIAQSPFESEAQE